MREQPTPARPPANKAMAETIQLLNTEPCSDLALLERVAAGIRTLGPDAVSSHPTPGDQDRVRHKFDRAVDRLRSAHIAVVRYAG